ncbi:antibiotic biosynthesis monooxygenase [Pseudomonas viridiflava]|uniref:antibiotic biosynthesis monooxygenase n=2 Tax=Pseudomonas syringae group TaxID=136849 RepID=UPI0013CEA6C8|nr:antibiotic biosynthesis monooxygenase [Pseudomonas viridiflava]
MTLIPLGAPFSQFIDFTVYPRYAASLVNALTARVEGLTRFCPGFLSGHIHLSDEHDRVLMQLCWSNQAHGEQAIARVQEAAPDLLQIANEHHATAIFFRAFNTIVEVGMTPQEDVK